MSEQTFLLILSTTLVIIIVVLLSFLSAVLWQLVKIMREVRGIVNNMRQGSDALASDLSAVRSQVKSFILGRLNRFGSAPARRKTSAKTNSSESQPPAEE